MRHGSDLRGSFRALIFPTINRSTINTESRAFQRSIIRAPTIMGSRALLLPGMPSWAHAVSGQTSIIWIFFRSTIRCSRALEITRFVLVGNSAGRTFRGWRHVSRVASLHSTASLRPIQPIVRQPEMAWLNLCWAWRRAGRSATRMAKICGPTPWRYSCKTIGRLLRA